MITIIGIDPGLDSHAIVAVRLDSGPPEVEQFEFAGGLVWDRRRLYRYFSRHPSLCSDLSGAQAVVIEFPVYQGPVRNAVPVTREAAALLVRLMDVFPSTAIFTPPVHITMKLATGRPRPDNPAKLAAVHAHLGVEAGGRGSQWNTTEKSKHHVDAALAAIWGIKTIGNHAARDPWRAGALEAQHG